VERTINSLIYGSSPKLRSSKSKDGKREGQDGLDKRHCKVKVVEDDRMV
jgi:hypothetical protein